MLKVLDLFSGIGGFSLGLESTGHFETVAFCEKDQFCQKVLKKHWSNIPIIDDVRRINGKEIKADVVVGGFPCQSISIAGKQKGKDDERYLWDEMFRVIKEVKPRWIIGENVQNLINIADGQILQGIHNDLEAENYEVQTFCISAASIGAWHKRSRVWIVANSNDRLSIGENKEIQTRGNSINNGSSTNVPNSKSKWSRECRELDKKKRLEKSKSTQSDCICSDVPNSDSRMRRRWRTIGESGTNQVWGFYSSEKEQSSNDIRSKTIGCDDIFREKQNLQYTNNKRCKESDLSTKSKKSDFGNREYDSTRENKTWWQTQSELCGVPNGVSYELDKDRANRVKSLGNSIVPQIARELGKAIIIAEND